MNSVDIDRSLVTPAEQVASFCENPKVGELFCDWMGAEILNRYLDRKQPPLTVDQIKIGLTNVKRSFCTSYGAAGLTIPIQHEFLSTHPSTHYRVNAFLLTHPGLRSKMNCATSAPPPFEHCSHRSNPSPQPVVYSGERIRPAAPSLHRKQGGRDSRPNPPPVRQ